MSIIRGIFSIVRLATKYGIAGGSVYLVYESGLWRDSDTTLKNFEKLKADSRKVYDDLSKSYPEVKTAVDFVQSSSLNAKKSVSEATSSAREALPSVDMSWLTSEGDGFVKPMYNKVVTTTFDVITHAPRYTKNLSLAGYQKLNELFSQEATASAQSSEK